MDSNKRLLRYNSITIVVWPIISVWLPALLTNDMHFFSITELIWLIIPLAIFSIINTLPFIVFAYWARLKIRIDNSSLLLKSLTYTFYSILAVCIISQLVFHLYIDTRTTDDVIFGLVMFLPLIPVGLAILLPVINSVIYKVLSNRDNLPPKKEDGFDEIEITSYKMLGNNSLELFGNI